MLKGTILAKLGFRILDDKSYRTQRQRSGRYINLNKWADADEQGYYQFKDSDGNILLVKEENCTQEMLALR